MAPFALRSPTEKVSGLFYFGRMLDKIRLHSQGKLPADYHDNLGKGFDEKCVRFLRVNYDELIERVKQGGSDEEILRWCFTNWTQTNGRRCLRLERIYAETPLG